MPSSDVPEDEDENMQHEDTVKESEQINGLPSPDTSANGDGKDKAEEAVPRLTNFGTPSRRVCLTRNLMLQPGADRLLGKEKHELRRI